MAPGASVGRSPLASWTTARPAAGSAPGPTARRTRASRPRETRMVPVVSRGAGGFGGSGKFGGLGRRFLRQQLRVDPVHHGEVDCVRHVEIAVARILIKVVQVGHQFVAGKAGEVQTAPDLAQNLVSPFPVEQTCRDLELVELAQAGARGI